MRKKIHEGESEGENATLDSIFLFLPALSIPTELVPIPLYMISSLINNKNASQEYMHHYNYKDIILKLFD